MAEKKIDLKRAFQVGTVCVGTYLISYYMRNLLSVSTPGMLEVGAFTKEFIGTLSSVYFLVYAIGQLINGYIGDRAKPKYMVSIGLLLCGISSVCYSVININALRIVFFGVMGFALSMLRGPLVKTICENTKSEHSHLICVFLSFTSFIGPFIASFFAIFFDWEKTFIVAGFSCIIAAFIVFIFFSIYERCGIITYRTRNDDGTPKKRGGIIGLFKLDNFVLYMIVGMICEIGGTTISFWIPTYLTERLGFEAEISGIFYSVITLIKAFTPFIALFILKLMKNNDIKMMRLSFAFATLFFVGVLFLTNSYVNIIFLLISTMTLRVSSTLLWSVYIPNQGKTGLVSSLNGFLDFTGYLAASGANMLFSFSMDSLGWDGIVMMWIALSAIGVVTTLMARRPKNKENINI